MCLHPQPVNDIPEQTVEIAKAAFPKGNIYMQMRDELGTFYEDEDFAELFPTRGQSAMSPWRLALITIMQFAENLTDRQAADAVRGRIDWKYALNLELTDPGFHYSVLSEFRQRLVENDLQEVLLDRMLETFQGRGWLKARGRQRTDSTHVLAAIRTLNRLELVGETMRYALNTLAEVAPEWLKLQLQPGWVDRYSDRVDNYRLPTQKKERDQLARTIGLDGYRLLYKLHDEATPLGLHELEAIETLRQVWKQQYILKNGDICWRETSELPPSATRIASPYEQEARYSRKRETEWVGYKVHLTETCDDDMPNLIIHVETTPATQQDIDVVEDIHTDIADKNLSPAQHIVDMAYVSSDVLASSHDQHQIELLGPVRADVSWQAHTEGAFDISCFTIDWDAKTVTCPMGNTNRRWREGTGKFGKPNVVVTFDLADCRSCSAHARCTRSQKRGLTFPQEAEYKALQAARQLQMTEAFKGDYRKRAGIEGTISQAAYALGGRQARYRGEAKSHLQHVATAAAINITRGVNWVLGKPKAQTRSSCFATLAAGF